MIHESRVKFTDNNNAEWVECPCCGFRSEQIMLSHMKTHNFKSIDEVKQQYPHFRTVSNVTSNRQSIRMLGDLNPGKGHGGKFSPFSKNFVGYTESTSDESIKLVVQKSMNSRKTRNNDTTTKEYYIKRGMSESEAASALTKRQKTFSKKICIEKYGETAGLAIWEDRQSRWLTTMSSKSAEEQLIINKKRIQRNGTSSKIEKRFLDELAKYVTDIEPQFLIKRDDTHHYAYDARIGKCIIEFNGSFWHANPETYKETDTIKFPGYYDCPVRSIWERDLAKIKVAEDNGFKTLVIWDNEFKHNKEQTIEKCVKFIQETNDSII